MVLLEYFCSLRIPCSIRTRGKYLPSIEQAILPTQLFLLSKQENANKFGFLQVTIKLYNKGGTLLTHTKKHTAVYVYNYIRTSEAFHVMTRIVVYA